MSVETTAFARVEDCAEEIRSVIAGAQHIVCLAHKDADADSLGSALGFALAVQAMGRTPHPVVPDPKPLMLTFLPGYELLEDAPEHVDAVFTFDCATVDRFGEKRPLIDPTQYPVVNVDHHLSNSGYGSINLVEPDASASGQVVHRLLTALGAPITPLVATNLYAAVLTDTGGFRHENTNEAVLRLGADLVHLGADPAFVALKSYKSREVSTLRLEALAVAALRAEGEGRLIWSEVTQTMLAQAQADMQQSEAVIDTLQSVDSMLMALLFKEISPELTKISVRTRGDIDATEICLPFGGGGHFRAAGAELELPLVQAEAVVLPLARKAVGIA